VKKEHYFICKYGLSIQQNGWDYASGTQSLSPAKQSGKAINTIAAWDTLSTIVLLSVEIGITRTDKKS